MLNEKGCFVWKHHRHPPIELTLVNANVDLAHYLSG